jgi:hypothetical protein
MARGHGCKTVKAFHSGVSGTFLCLGAILRTVLADVEADFFLWQNRGRGEQGLEFSPDEAEGVVVLEEFGIYLGELF